MSIRSWTKLLLTCAACNLAACGGGGGGGGGSLVSTPTPTPTPAGSVKIFTTPTVGEYVTVGVSSNDDLIALDDRLTSISTADAAQAHIRFNSAGYYEVQLPGSDWDRLVHYKGLLNPTQENTYFQPEDVAQNMGFLAISKSRDLGYLHSELASWGNLNLSVMDGFGWAAFGVPTQAGSVPMTGSATYSGIAAGSADIMVVDNLYGGAVPSYVDGTVLLNFDYGAGTLGGSMTLAVNNGSTSQPIGTFNFTDTVYSAGATTYSGKFDSVTTGINFFLGRFTGPNAEETIGAWALPFTFSGDGEAHQAMGAWIAKKP